MRYKWVWFIFVLFKPCESLFAQGGAPVASTDVNAVPSYGGGMGEGSASSVGLSVDGFTGKVQMGLPLGNAGDPATTVSLSYSSGGFKPTDASSVVGLGWDLQCGGAVTRVVRGIPDEQIREWDNPYASNYKQNVGPFLNYDRIKNFNPANPRVRSDNTSTYWEPNEDRLLDKVGANEFDSELDVFSVSAPGISTSFTILYESENQAPKIQFLTPQKYNLEVLWLRNSANQIVGFSGFKVYLMDGSVYWFTKELKPQVQMVVRSYGVYTDTTVLLPGKDKNTDLPQYTLAWLITKIDRPDGDVVQFGYRQVYKSVISSSVAQRMHSRTADVYSEGLMNDPTAGVRMPESVHNQIFSIQSEIELKIETITCRRGKVQLTYFNNLNNQNQGMESLLASIRFYQMGRLVNYVELGYEGLLTGGGTVPLTATTNPDLSRVVLHDIEQFSAKGVSPGKTLFRYHNRKNATEWVGFPKGLTDALDHWGYFNGVPRTNIYDPVLQKANGGAVFECTKLGLIAEVEGSDGSRQTIDYEPNSVYDVEAMATYVSGGVRVKSTTFIPKTGPERTTQYTYGNESNWNGGISFHSQNPAGISYTKIQNFGFQICMGLNENQVDLGILHALAYYTLDQASPVNQLTDNMERAAYYPKVKIVLPDGKAIINTFSRPQIEAATNTQIKVWGDYPTFPDNSWDEEFTLWYQKTEAYAQLLNPNYQVKTHQEIKAAAVHTTLWQVWKYALKNLDLIASNQIFTRTSWFDGGGTLLESRTFYKDQTPASVTTTQFKTLTVATLPRIKVLPLFNFNFYFHKAHPPFDLNPTPSAPPTNLVQAHYKGTDFTSVAHRLNHNQYYLFSYEPEVITIQVPETTLTETYDTRGRSTLVRNVIRYNEPTTSESRLFAKAKETENSVLLTSAPGIALSHHVSEIRYLSEIIGTESSVLESQVYANLESFLANGGDRTTAALVVLNHFPEGEMPMEIRQYGRKGNVNTSFENGQVNVPYLWGTATRPMLFTKYNYGLELLHTLAVDGATHLPVGYTPLAFTVSSGLNIENTLFVKQSEVIEVNESGTPVTSKSLPGNLSSVITGYGNSSPIAEIAYAKASECGYTSFEAPIHNFTDENGWTVNLYPKTSQLESYVRIVPFGFSGRKSAHVQYGFGPTKSILLDKNHLKPYIFEAWIRRPPGMSHHNTVRMRAYLHPTLTNFQQIGSYIWGTDFEPTDEWQHIKIEIPLGPNITTTGNELCLRVFVEGTEDDMDDLGTAQGFLIDECRVYPKDALIKTTALDMESGTQSSVDVTGKKVESRVQSSWSETVDWQGNLKSVQIFNPGK